MCFPEVLAKGNTRGLCNPYQLKKDEIASAKMKEKFHQHHIYKKSTFMGSFTRVTDHLFSKLTNILKKFYANDAF